MRFICLFTPLLTALALVGCAGTRSPVADSVMALLATGGTGLAKDAIPALPDPRFSYLRVQVQGYPPALLVLGYVDAHPLGPVEVWYSGNREAIRLQNGRLVGSTGALHGWAAVRFEPPPPAWANVSSQGARYVRQRDEMPGYRFAVKDQIQLSVWQGLPPLALPASLPLATAQGYQWFRESALPLAGQGGVALPDAWFAWGQYRGESAIVYSEQCLAPDFCLKLQRWPLLEESK